jgi:hypothetical protein
MRVFLLPALLAVTGFGGGPEGAIGTWKMNPARSTLTGGAQPSSFVVRIEPHLKGEVFTLDRTEQDGRTTSSSTILYLDDKPRDFEDHECSGTQSSRRVDGQTVELLRKCGNGEWTRLVRRGSTKANELVLEITQQHVDGRRVAWRLVLEKQPAEQ